MNNLETNLNEIKDKKEKNEQCWNEFLVDRKNTTYLQ